MRFFSLDLEKFKLCFSFSSRNMRITICYLDLVSKHENNRTKISISSRQVRAINIILDLVSIFLHISHDILKSSYMIHFSLRQLMEHQQKKVKVNIFGYIFNLCDSGDNTGEKPQHCLAILWKASKGESKVQVV